MGTEKGACLFQGDLLLRSWCFLSQFPSAPCESKIQHMLCASCACLHTPARHFELSQSLLSTGGAELHWTGNSCFSKCIVNLVTICNSLESCFVLWQWIRQGWDFRAGPGMVWKPKSSWVYKAQGWRSGCWMRALTSGERIPIQLPHHLHLQVNIAHLHKEKEKANLQEFQDEALITFILLWRKPDFQWWPITARDNFPEMFPLSADEMCTCTWGIYTKKLTMHKEFQLYK